MSRRVLVAGVGNVFLGDDAFGVEVVRRLAGAPLPARVRVEDFGIRGVHLAYELLEGWDTLILVDAAPAGEAPGTVFVLEPELGGADADERREAGFLVDAHSMDPVALLATVAELGGAPPRVRVVGCEPADLGERMGLSPVVAAAVDVAVGVVRELIERECEGAPAFPGSEAPSEQHREA